MDNKLETDLIIILFEKIIIEEKVIYISGKGIKFSKRKYTNINFTRVIIENIF